MQCHRCAQDTVKNMGSYAAVTCSPKTMGLKLSGPAGRKPWASPLSHDFHFFHPLGEKILFGEIDVCH